MTFKSHLVSVMAFALIFSAENALADTPVIKINGEGLSVKSIHALAGKMLHLTCESSGKQSPELSCTASDIYNRFTTHTGVTATRHVIVNIRVNDTGRTFKCNCVEGLDKDQSASVEVVVGSPVRASAFSSGNSGTLTRELSAGVTVLLLIAVLMISIVPVSWFIYKSGKPEQRVEETELCSRAFTQNTDTMTV